MSGNRLWLDMSSWPLVSSITSHMVGAVTTKFTRAQLTQLALRRLRATFWYESVMNSDSSDIAKRDHLEEYAKACNQSLEIFLKHYVMACPNKNIEEHKRLTNAANSRAFDTSNVAKQLYEGNMYLFKSLNKMPSQRAEKDPLWLPSKMDHRFRQRLEESKLKGII
jgi:hypothetical protein